MNAAIETNLKTLVLLILAALLISAQPDIFENDVFTVRQIVLGGQTARAQLFSATVVNRTETARTFALDIRTESFGLGW